VHQEPGAAERHDANLGKFDAADESALGESIRDLAGQRGEQKERQNEESTRGCDQLLGRESGMRARAEGEREDERVLEQIVVERAQELGPEEGSEAPLRARAAFRSSLGT
jgi:hypothetical protein